MPKSKSLMLRRRMASSSRPKATLRTVSGLS
jgi:hypothetical protein